MMGDVIVYHGAIEIVQKPVCSIGRKNLDFGQGFYVTDIREQAIAWAELVSSKRNEKPILNRYLLNREAILQEAHCKIFTAYDKQWLDFSVLSRQGNPVANDYDYIEGGVANDRVIDTVNLYMSGLMDIDTALRRLSAHQANNQMCLLNQDITDKYLIFNGTEEF